MISKFSKLLTNARAFALPEAISPDVNLNLDATLPTNKGQTQAVWLSL